MYSKRKKFTFNAFVDLKTVERFNNSTNKRVLNLLETVKLIVNQFSYQWAQVVHGAMALNDQLRRLGDQRSSSREADYRFGGVAAEAPSSVRLGKAAFLVTIISQFILSLNSNKP